MIREGWTGCYVANCDECDNTAISTILNSKDETKCGFKKLGNWYFEDGKDFCCKKCRNEYRKNNRRD